MAGIGRWCFRHRVIVLLLWVVTLAGLGIADRTVGSAYSSDFALPGTESTHALDLVNSAFPAQSGDPDTIVWHVTHGSVRDAAVQQPVAAMLGKVAAAPSVTAVTSPYGAAGATQISPDGRTAYATVTFAYQGGDVSRGAVQQVVGIAKSAGSPGLDIELGGGAIQAETQTSTSISEVVGVAAAAVVLLVVFGSLLAMLLPLIAACLSLVTATLTIGLLSNVISMNSIAPTVAALIGLGVGIDYALFIITRHRSGITAGLSPEESATRALNTSGRAVIFAGGTVCIAMLGLLVLRVSFLTGIGISSAITVLFTVLAAVTLLPALLGFLGDRALGRRQRRQLAAVGPHETHTSGFWARWSDLLRRRPRLLTPVAALIMIVLTLPVFALHLGSADAGNDPAGSTTRKAYDLLAEGFGPGFNGPLQLVAQLHSPGDRQALTGLIDEVRHTPGVAAADPVALPPDSTLGMVQVVPTTAPQDTRTSDLIDTLRSQTIPAAEQGNSMQVYVGGQTAVFDDFASVLTGKLPLFLGVIVGLGFLLLMVAFRSLLVPLTASVMNLLAAAASFGVVVAFFQWGWGSSMMGLGRSGPIEAFLPVMLLAILFGLSMDYQVFLVSRMHEEWMHTRDNRRAVSTGQACTGRVITAAATIMISVFLAFVFGGQRVIAEFGVGLASAVFIDAFILRTVLVPALMHLFGRANWWLPRWLDRLVPHLSVEPVRPTGCPPAEPDSGTAGAPAAHPLPGQRGVPVPARVVG